MPEVIPMIPASSKVLWALLVGLILLFAVLAGVFAFIAYSSQNVRFELTAEHIRVRGDLFARTIPVPSLVLEKSRQVSLESATELQPRWRMFGSSLPGYRSGWFRLRNGEKALLYVTDRRRVVYLPTRDGYSLLLSVPEPQRFLMRLASVATGR